MPDSVDPFWSILYLTLAAFTVLYAWRGTCRPLAIAILLDVGVTTALSMRIEAAGMPFINVLAELIVMLTAAYMSIYTPKMSVALIALGTLSCMVSLVYSTARDLDLQDGYESIVNGILVIECALVMNAKVLCALGARCGRFWRWYLGRRRAAHAARRVGLATATLAQSQLVRAVKGIWLRG